MATDSNVTSCGFGSSDLRLPDELRVPLLSHLQALRGRYQQRGWAGRVGFGARPAVIDIDLADVTDLDEVVNQLAHRQKSQT